MVTIFLVRHGQDEDNANDIIAGNRDRPLTELGIQQSHQTASKLKQHHIDAVYSSPLQKCIDTANIIAKELNLNEVTIKNNLIERNFGSMTGKSAQTSTQKGALSQFYTETVAQDEGNSESHENLYERAQQALKEIESEQPDKVVVVVTHGHFGRMLRAAYLHRGWQEALKAEFMKNGEVVRLGEKVDEMD